MSMANQEKDEPALRLRGELFDFHGVSMSAYLTDNWDKVQSFRAKPDDVVIASFPKAGTTWVSHLLDLLYFGASAPERGSSVPILQRVPFLEIYVPAMRLSGHMGHFFLKIGTDNFTSTAEQSCLFLRHNSGGGRVDSSIPRPGSVNVSLSVELLDKMSSSPRLVKTHLPVQFLPKSFWEQKCRIVYVARNPKDSVVSYFHFDRMNQVQPEPGDWASYLRRFQEGKVTYGSWYDHVTGWWDKSQTYPNLLYLRYEDLAEDMDRELGRVCSFLGLCPSEEDRRHVKEAVAFDVMRNNPTTNGSLVKVMDFKVSPFMRKGKVGDWKNHFTVSQNEQFDEEYEKKMANTTLRFRTEI